MGKRQAQRDTLLLDPRRYDEATRKWDVPLIRLGHVKIINLTVGDQSITDIKSSGNYLKIPKNIRVEANSVAKLEVEYSKERLFVAFWLPIVIAVISLIGNVVQTLIINPGFNEQTGMNTRFFSNTWKYDTDTFQFSITLSSENLTDDQRKNWRILVAVRQRQAGTSAMSGKYLFVGGPYIVSPVKEYSVLTDAAFANAMRKHDRLKSSFVEAVVFLARTQIRPKGTFRPGDHSENDIKVIYHVGM